MNDDRGLAERDWSFSELERIDAVCDEFERAWKGIARLDIAQLLAKNTNLPRDELLEQLLCLEMHLRRSEGESPDLDQYQPRFPADKEILARAWQDFIANSDSRILPPTTTFHPPPQSPTPLPKRIGRFEIQRFLGHGSFGVVYLARDPSSGCDVALKVPHSKANSDVVTLEGLTGKDLDHPHLVRTLGVEDADGQLVIVQQFIDGRNLTDWHAQTRPTPEQVVRLLIPVAQALGYLHEQGVFHRDLKPGNILVDLSDNPFVADFGLALREAQQRHPNRRGELAGTYAYMAPEQVRRQTQLIDGQTDLWSFGVIIYRLLTDRFPFGGPPPRKKVDELAYIDDLKFEIAEHDPRPPRQINPAITRKLEQICLRCLEKRKRDRYQTGHDLAEDLRLVLERSKSPGHDPSRESKIQIVPKGLRSFDAADAPFFQELLPGPRTLEGIPTSLSFWKNRLTDASGDGPIDVGVIYGPSGCGKSSLVKAGLVPLLGDKFVPLLIESTPKDSEVRLLKALRKALPDMPHNFSLIDACRWVGEQGAGSGRKVLLIFDQFEQWLHSHPSPVEQQFLSALRSCNGTRLQALLLVRDDFWMPLTRFMDQLEIPLQENNNAAAVDLFDCDHAHRVLLSLGRAYGRMPGSDQELTTAQQKFLSSAVEGLAEDRRIICVRLALFAEMMKDRPWTSEELANVGGAKGIGVSFLEEKFGPKAPAVYKPHRASVRKVLDALLPPFGGNLKGQMRTVVELQKVSVSTSVSSFEQLLHILDTDLKIITPVLPDQPSGRVVIASNSSESLAFQLTHDYLVPSIREWLTRKQQETWRGRCELRLEERASLWSWRPEPKQLPSLWETAQITLGTSSANWTVSQASLMRQAQRMHGWRIMVFCCTLALILAAGWGWHHSNQVASQRRIVETQLEKLMVVETSRVPLVLQELKPTYDIWNNHLRMIANNSERPTKERLRAELALISRDHSRIGSLVQLILSSDPETMKVVQAWLDAEARPNAEELWNFMNETSQRPASRLRLATLLAAIDPLSEARWRIVSRDIALALLAESEIEAWTDQLRPAGQQLTPALAEEFLSSESNSSRRQTAAQALSKLGSTDVLCRLLLDADTSQLPLFIRAISQDRNKAIEFLRPILSVSPPITTVESRLRHVARQRMSCVALMLLGRDDLVWPLLETAEDQTLRTELILSLTSSGVPLETLFRGEETVRDPVARQAIWLAMAGRSGELPADQMAKVVKRLTVRFPQVEHLAERSAMTWLALRCRASALRELVKPRPSSRGADWFVNSQGQMFAEIRGPVEFMMGSPDDEPRRDGNEARHRRKIDRSFTIAVHEVTVEQFRKFRADYSPDSQVGPSPQCPASTLSWLDAVKYCRWLSEQENIAQDQMCYPSVDQIHDKMTFRTDLLARTGYRLPTEAEWEFVCRAGTTGRYFFGENEQNASSFAWVLTNSQEVTWPVGQLRPNAFGLFDIQGNIQEWCQDAFKPYPTGNKSVATTVAEIEPLSNTERVFRGAMYRSPCRPMRSAFRYRFPPSANVSILGFRMARTIPRND